MFAHWSDWPAETLALLRRGTVIPAHPLALDAQRGLDVRHQRALTRYYIDAGAGGLAVGVHSTQFAIREVGLYEPVLKLAAETARDWLAQRLASGAAVQPLLLIAGLAGRTAQAVAEARMAQALGYHAGMLSLAEMKGASVDELVAHCQAVAEVVPLVGFYLQTAVGGIALPSDFWRRFAAIDNVVAIKMAPFDRYRTLDVVMHADPALMPAHRRDWSAVNARVSPAHERPESTIWINAVQPALRHAAPLFQTVQPQRAPRDEHVIATARFERPMVDTASQHALVALQALAAQPGRRVWLCGSYAQAGVPLLESAVRSAHDVAAAIDSRVTASSR